MYKSQQIALSFLLAVGAAGCLLPRGVYAQARMEGRSDSAVFNGPAADMVPDIFAPHESSPILRTLSVKERVGNARKNELVRVPLFFHEGECSDPNKLQIVSVADKKVIPFQADDIRRDASGSVSRMHAYFYTTIEPWQQQKFNLVAGLNPGAALPAMPATQKDGKVTLAGEDIQVTFFDRGDLGGAIAAIKTATGPVSITNYAAPKVNLIRQRPVPKADAFETLRTNLVTYASPETLDIRDLRWSAGPIFSKLIVRIGPKDVPDNAEYIYIIPKHGNEFLQIQRLFPDEKDINETVGMIAIPTADEKVTLPGNVVLQGKIALGDAGNADELVKVTAGLRKLTRRVTENYNTAIVDAGSGMSLFMIPYSQNGSSVSKSDSGEISINGSQSFKRNPGSNSGSLRVFWGQSRFVFSKSVSEEDLWKLSVEKFQPFTAVVDEPWATPEHYSKFTTQASEGLWNIRNWSRGMEATLAMTHMKGDFAAAKALAEKVKPAPDTALQRMVPTKEEIDTAWKGFKGAGGTDPWTITYQRSGIVLASAFIYPSEGLDKQSELVADACRLTNGRVNKYNSPNVRSFANAVNMHVGPHLMGLWGGRKYNNVDLTRFTLDCLYNQALQTPYGHGQRQYSMNVGEGGASDQLYMAITDMWSRAIELAANEDLTLHPAIYGRYTDCIDVNSDLYQRRILSEGGSSPTWWRAAMMRGQQHDHRWEAFGGDPFMAMIEDASNPEKPTGLTEACYYIQRLAGRQVGYNIVMSDAFFPDVLLRYGLKNYKPAARPALPAHMNVTYAPNNNVITWDAVAGDNITGYRIYRADRIGGPWTWLNSPYASLPSFVPPTDAQRPRAKPVKKGEKPEPVPAAEPYDFVVPRIPVTLIKGTSYTDTTGTPTSLYLVTAEDKQFRESRWFPHEPIPLPSPTSK